jgi:hypothetical protein
MGAGGGSSKAQKQAAADDAKKQADISSAISGINNIYDNPDRQKQYDQLSADTTKYYTDDVNKQETVAARKQKFALARSGLSGGSEQAYQGKMLGEDYSKALIDASRRGQSAGANLRSADEQSRNNLINMAEAGLGCWNGTRIRQPVPCKTTCFPTNPARPPTASAVHSATSQACTKARRTPRRMRQQQRYGFGLYQSPMFGGQNGGGSVMDIASPVLRICSRKQMAEALADHPQRINIKRSTISHRVCTAAR